MTEYSDIVENTRLQQELEKWSVGVKYIHYNNWIEDVKFNNGDVLHTDTRTGKKWTDYKNLNNETLLNRFLRSQSGT
jgi:hypothetical protein|tara:strand:+ start:92 stop:322 length:231 start_codon:yes stop_codon:yes gene_type:complete